MLIHKVHVEKLIEARLRPLTPPLEGSEDLYNELVALHAAVNELPQVQVEEGQVLAKSDPLETAMDMVKLKIRQLTEDGAPGSFAAIRRLSELGTALRQACSTSVEDFEEEGDDCGGPYIGRYGGVIGNMPNPRVRVRPMRRGAPYGFGEDPMGQGGLPADMNDLYREVIQAIGPLVESRKKDSEVGQRRDAARELQSLLQSRPLLVEARLSTVDVDKRIEQLTQAVGATTLSAEGQDLLRQHEDLMEKHREKIPKLDPECEHCQEYGAPIVMETPTGQKRVHVLGTEHDCEPRMLDCRTLTPFPSEIVTDGPVENVDWGRFTGEFGDGEVAEPDADVEPARRL